LGAGPRRCAIFGTGDETADEDADKVDIPIQAFDDHRVINSGNVDGDGDADETS
jgi:hypothetical protein